MVSNKESLSRSAASLSSHLRKFLRALKPKNENIIMLAHKEVAQFPNAHMIASIMKLFFGWFPVENKVTLPSPTPREKKICPAASIHTTGSLSLSH